MNLVANNDLIIFVDSDSFDNSNTANALLNQSQTVIDATIGSANYDIGHTVSTGGGGVAQLNSPCGSGKARGITGQGSPVGDPFDIDYVAHEMGHQFGGNHTQNNNCNRSDNIANNDIMMSNDTLLDVSHLSPSLLKDIFNYNNKSSSSSQYHTQQQQQQQQQQLQSLSVEVIDEEEEISRRVFAWVNRYYNEYPTYNSSCCCMSNTYNDDFHHHHDIHPRQQHDETHHNHTYKPSILPPLYFQHQGHSRTIIGKV
jgi:hypothetical protein